MNKYELQRTLNDLDNLYSEIHSGLGPELDDIIQGINEAWDSEIKGEFMQRTSILSKLLDETAVDINKLREMLLADYWQSIRVSERNEPEERSFLN